MEIKNHNNKQDIDIVSMQKDIEYIKCDLRAIKDNHLVHLQNQIEELSSTVAKQPSWKLISLLIGTGTFLAGVAITIITVLLK